MNRGFRIQYSSALGPYEGGLHFSGGMSSDVCKVGVLGYAAIILVLIFLEYTWYAIFDTGYPGVFACTDRRLTMRSSSAPFSLLSHGLKGKPPGEYESCNDVAVITFARCYPVDGDLSLQKPEE